MHENKIECELHLSKYCSSQKTFSLLPDCCLWLPRLPYCSCVLGVGPEQLVLPCQRCPLWPEGQTAVGPAAGDSQTPHHGHRGQTDQWEEEVWERRSHQLQKSPHIIQNISHQSVSQKSAGPPDCWVSGIHLTSTSWHCSPDQLCNMEHRLNGIGTDLHSPLQPNKENFTDHPCSICRER